MSRLWLPVWFAVISATLLATIVTNARQPFFDASLYLAATRAWLVGANPWDVQIDGIYFAAPPPSLLPLAPFALLPPTLGVAVLAVAVAAGAVASIRLLRLQWWWLMFPPLVECVISANVQGLLLPLILLDAGAVAAILKIYALVPLAVLGRWRAVLLAGILLLASWPLLPWSTYVADLPVITARLVEQTHYALPTTVLVVAAPFALAALISVGRKRGAWLIVPAIWPAQQYYYGTLAMGARNGLAAGLVAIPVPGSGLLALITLAVVERLRRGRSRPEPIAGPAEDRTFGAATSAAGSVDSGS